MLNTWTRAGRRALQPLAGRLGNATLPGRGILANRFLAAKLLPLAARGPYSILVRDIDLSETDDGLPVPPRRHWERWGYTLESYLRGGRLDAERILADLADVGVDSASLRRVLDFGCGEGRVLRFFPGRGERDLWGVDLNADRIAWCLQNLMPPFRFATTTSAPHLPFADGSFDLAYAISVFTHISELADAWLLELLRVLRPGGHLYLTIHDEHSVELLLAEDANPRTTGELAELVKQLDRETHVLSMPWLYFAIHADPGALVFHRADELVRRWSALAEIRAVKPAAIGYQTALILRNGEERPPRGSPR